MQASEKIAISLCNWLTGYHHQPLQLLLYRGVRDEVETAALFTPPAAKIIYAPRVVEDTMVWVRVATDTVWHRGRFGVLEPQSDSYWQPTATIPTVVACPLTAFDRAGGRVGMGKGYFDRWLAHYRPNVTAVLGLAFACQEYHRVPMAAYDQPMQWVITEKESIACHSKS